MVLMEKIRLVAAIAEILVILFKVQGNAGKLAEFLSKFLKMNRQHSLDKCFHCPAEPLKNMMKNIQEVYL